jgi:hypothetical protein
MTMPSEDAKKASTCLMKYCSCAALYTRGIMMRVQRLDCKEAQYTKHATTKQAMLTVAPVVEGVQAT